MNRIVFLLLLILTIGGHATAQPSKGKKKAKVAKAKTAAAQSVKQMEEEQIRLMMDKAMSVVEELTKKLNDNTSSDSAYMDSNGQFTKKPYGWVNDFENLFTLAQQTELDSLITAFEKATTVEIAIVTIDSAQTTKKDFDTYVTDLGKRWGVGKKETNNGVVIGICPGYRLIRISTGLGIMQQLTDGEVKAIIDNIIIPQYRQGDYFSGTKLGLLAVMQELQTSN